MDFDDVAETDLETLKCVLCSSWLSHFPIHITDKKENICGRCNIPSDRRVFMNEAFQALAKHIFFPCRYTVQGCDQKLQPKEVISHEKNCPFRIVKCPIKEYSVCIWEGAKPSLLEHCHESHSDLFLIGRQFNLLLSSDDITVKHNLLEHDSALFVIVQKFSPSDHFLDFSIFHIESDEDLDQLSCEVELRTDNRHLVATCSTTSYQNQKPTEIYLNSLKDSKNATISATGEVRLQNSVFYSTSSKNSNNSDLLAQLKCNICETYILPPVLQYIDAFNNQKIVCSKCPASESRSYRNFNLDNIANLIDYPCENFKRGCNFVSKPSSMVNHKKLCLYQNLPCPVIGFYHSLCNWNGLYGNLKIHLQANHLDLYIARSTVISVKVACLEKQSNTEPNSTVYTSSSSTSNFPFSKFSQSETSSAIFGSLNNTISEISSFRTSKLSDCKYMKPPSLKPVKPSSKFSQKLVSTKSPGFLFDTPKTIASSGALPFGSTFEFNKPIFGSSLATSAATSTTNSAVTNHPTFETENSLPVSADDLPADGLFLKKQCYLTKFSNKILRIIYGETIEKFIWYVHVIGPFIEGFMFCLDIVDKKNSKKILKMQLPVVEFTNDEDIINSSCYVWKKDVTTYLTDDEISFKISVLK